MKARYDPEAKCLYVDMEVERTGRILSSKFNTDDNLLMDFDETGELVGIEFIDVEMVPYDCQSKYCGGHCGRCGDDE